ncbi:alpha/beta hydrolase [Mycobacterium sp. 852002-51152_SCH6134967]|uniref:alpha/beta fold hydrolase n=1 Tax=Mycobacterium sp. 852002-51152_SCH6134967 TaxID=1834096 RepID=UPI000801D53F|nr:alpha/beta hydrolase [Mycobacterium sp. 852002-51152_SCH6134967]OBF89007.1 alpha/beta hydrolase [Mycobacterium sp. 852002-51152_SCH6134967]
MRNVLQAQHRVDLSAGVIEYSDTGGNGPVVVLLHGVNMDNSVWDNVVARLAPEHRCICPILPLGSHRQPMRRGELVTHEGVAALVGEFIDRLDLRDVTLVLNDWGGAQFLVAEGAERIAALVLVACEAFENYPPGLPGKAVASCAKIPGALWLTMQLQRFDWFRRAPGGWGWMAKHPIPKDVMDQWFRPALVDSGVRRDLRTFAGSTPSRARLAELTEQLRTFDRPVLVAWAPEDKVMPAEHGRRLESLFPHGCLVEIRDSYTLIPLDQPARLADELREFVAASVLRSGGTAG